MNSIIILPEERTANVARLEGPRAAYAFFRHELRTGLVVRAAELGGNRGLATVVSASNEVVCLELTLDKPPMPRELTALIVAVSRPQTIKKIIHLATTLGLSELHLVRTANVEKSYLQSKVLENEAMKAEVILGLEQSCDSIPPAIHVHKNFQTFMGEVLPTVLEPAPGEKISRLLAHTSAGNKNFLQDPAKRTQKTIVAIGPEAGWSEQELAKFQNADFELIGLGERILRVEVAAAVVLGFITCAKMGPIKQ